MYIHKLLSQHITFLSPKAKWDLIPTWFSCTSTRNAIYNTVPSCLIPSPQLQREQGRKKKEKLVLLQVFTRRRVECRHGDKKIEIANVAKSRLAHIHSSTHVPVYTPLSPCRATEEKPASSSSLAADSAPGLAPHNKVHHFRAIPSPETTDAKMHVHGREMFTTSWHEQTMYKLCIKWQCSFSGVCVCLRGPRWDATCTPDNNIHRLDKRKEGVNPTECSYENKPWPVKEATCATATPGEHARPTSSSVFKRASHTRFRKSKH